MSLFGLMGGEFDDDFLGNHMNAMNMQMRSMNRLMNSFMPDPFNMLTPFDGGFQQNALMERNNVPNPMGGLFGFGGIPNMNRLLSADIGSPLGGASFCSSSVVTMSSGPDGRPQIYQATTSTKTGPGGIRETRNTVQDSTRGVKKMAIGHHIGQRSHIIEKEQDLRSGQLEERQEFINLDEDEAEDFDREFTNRSNVGGGRRGVAAICGRPQQQHQQQQQQLQHHQQQLQHQQLPQHTLTIEPIDDDDDDEVEHVSSIHQATGAGPSAAATATTSQAAAARGHSNNGRRGLPAAPQPSAHQNSSTCTGTSTVMPPTTTLPYTTSVDVANANVAAAASYNNNNYLNGTPPPTIRHRTTSGYRNHHPHHLHHHHHLAAGVGATARRPLRTPSSSPLATTPTTHNHSTAASPSYISRDWRLYNPRFYRK